MLEAPFIRCVYKVQSLWWDGVGFVTVTANAALASKAEGQGDPGLCRGGCLTSLLRFPYAPENRRLYVSVIIYWTSLSYWKMHGRGL